MATARQIAANRANAAKSTGPITPKGKRISSQNRSLHKLLSASAAFKGVLKGEPPLHYDALSAALVSEFQPRDAIETALIRTMTVARWRMLCAGRIQTAALRREIVRARRDHPPETPLATLAAIAFRRLTASSSSFTRAHRLEAHYDCEYNRALAELLRLRKIQKSRAAPHRPTRLDGETGVCDFFTEAKFETASSQLFEDDLIYRE